MIKELFEKFAIEDTSYDLVLESMNAIETEMNRNGGCNWKHDDYLFLLVRCSRSQSKVESLRTILATLQNSAILTAPK